jgi:hypothetical protein
MNHYTVHISFLALGSPTDLELEDLMRSFADVLDDPSVVGIEDRWVPADYSIESYIVEMFDEDDTRVWRFSASPVGGIPLDAFHSLHYPNMGNKQEKRLTVVERLKLLAIRIRNFYFG